MVSKFRREQGQIWKLEYLFFSSQAMIRRRRNKVSGLNNKGVWCTNTMTLTREAYKFFMHHFKYNCPYYPYCLTPTGIPHYRP